MGMSIVNAEKCCKGKWTRSEDGHNSILDYIIVLKDDVCYVDGMVIDEARDMTPYRVTTEEPKEIKYSDHYMIAITFNWMIKIKEESRTKWTMGRQEYQRYKKEIDEEEISKIIEPDRFDETYTKWSEKVIAIAAKTKRREKRKKDAK